jgi:translation initiation factor IF-3
MNGCLASVFFSGYNREEAIAYKKYKPREPQIRANRRIRVPEVRVIDSNGEQLGVMPTERALEAAMEQGLDLVEVSPTARPPVCRIMDFGKYKYEQSKRQKQSKKKQHAASVKEVKLRPKTEEHDYQFKKRHAEEFLERNHKVKFTLMFRGRELDHKERGRQMLDRMAEDLSHVGTVEREPRFEGRIMVMYMAPLGAKAKPKEKPETPPASGEKEVDHAETEN